MKQPGMLLVVVGNLLAGKSAECVQAAEWTITNLQMDERTRGRSREQEQDGDKILRYDTW